LVIHFFLSNAGSYWAIIFWHIVYWEDYTCLSYYSFLDTIFLLNALYILTPRYTFFGHHFIWKYECIFSFIYFALKIRNWFGLNKVFLFYTRTLSSNIIWFLFTFVFYLLLFEIYNLLIFNKMKSWSPFLNSSSSIWSLVLLWFFCVHFRTISQHHSLYIWVFDLLYPAFLWV
jgi:hypothetical protein